MSAIIARDLTKSYGKARGVEDLSLDVQDTGVGIPDDQTDRVFEAFTQRHGQSINEYGGTGVGLALTQRLLRLMDGGIRLASQEGVGTTCHVVLSAVEVADHTPLGDLQTETESPSTEPGGVEPATWTLEGLDEEALKQVPALIEKLESRKTTCADLAMTLTINDVESFAADVQDLAAAHRFDQVGDWAGLLAQKCMAFDMNGVAEALGSYDRLVDSLKQAAQS